jgi:glutamine synthetase
MDRLCEAAVRLLRIFGNKNATRVHSTVGPEQEYFLIDKAYYLMRPDLILTGRSLFGAKPPKGQEMEDHYFGSIRDRILAFMHDVEIELFKLGIPVKTRHNEVAPAQFEIAPIFEDSNLATDHNQMVMETLRKISGRHGLALLLHEKPFAGVNGSGKHNNWSMSDNLGNNLLEPGKTPHENLQFLTFLVATIKGVYKYSDLLRASIASAGNDHRLGANEAPPAIISVFLGEQLGKILDNIEGLRQTDYTDQAIIDLGVDKLPVIAKDATDRNRTSPFAFTGNKFEFRAVGSSQSISSANVVLNAIATEMINEFSDAIEANIRKGMDLNKAVMEVLIPAIKESKPIRFEGNGYSPEWEKEAAKRGLPNKKTTPEALADLIAPKNKSLLTKHRILSESEIDSRYIIELEHYIKSRNIEAESTLDIAKTMIYPAVVKFQDFLAGSINSLKAAGGSAKALKVQMENLNTYADLVADFSVAIAGLEKSLEKRDDIHDEPRKAEFYSKEILPAMEKVRDVSDKLEELTDDDLWPLPKYREMLFNY